MLVKKVAQNQASYNKEGGQVVENNKFFQRSRVPYISTKWEGGV